MTSKPSALMIASRIYGQPIRPKFIALWTNLLVQLYFAAQVPDAAIVQLLEQELEARRQKLAECEALRSPAPPRVNATHAGDDPTVSRQQNLHQLVLELVTQREQVYLDWLQQAIVALRSMD